MGLVYTIGDELGDAKLYWRDEYHNFIDFSSGYTFSIQVYDEDGVSQFAAKTSGITGATGSASTVPPTPNVVVAWATTVEISSITTPGVYQFRCVATRTADGKTRTFRDTLTILSIA